MRKKLAKLPSPAMAVAFLALLAALTGTAVALPGSNTVTTGDIKGGAVRSSDIKNNNVRGRDVRTSTLRGSDVGANTLTGSDINEASLGPVQVAGTAGSANTANVANSAGRLTSQTKLSYTAPASTAARVIYDSGRLRLTAECDGAGDLTLDATTTVSNATIHSYGTSSDTNEDDFDTGDVETVSESQEERDIVYSEPGGQVVVLQYGATEGGVYGGAAECLVKGLAQVL